MPTKTHPIPLPVLEQMYTARAQADDGKQRSDLVSDLLELFGQGCLRLTLLGTLDQHPDAVAEIAKGVTGPERSTRYARRIAALLAVTARRADLDDRRAVGVGWIVPTPKQLGRLIRYTAYESSHRCGIWSRIIPSQIQADYLARLAGTEPDHDGDDFIAEATDHRDRVDPYSLADAHEVTGCSTVAGSTGQVLWLAVLTVRGEHRVHAQSGREYRVRDIVGYRSFGTQPDLARYVGGWTNEQRAAIEAQTEADAVTEPEPFDLEDPNPRSESTEAALVAQHGGDPDPDGFNAQAAVHYSEIPIDPAELAAAMMTEAPDDPY